MKKTIFVIMPFSRTPLRGEEEMTSFFESNLKKPIETYNFGETSFVVKRSDDRFDITKGIIQDLYRADIVICDLSGPNANPNVMYELGVRLAISNRPVILIREAHSENKRIFDISGFHTMEYSPLRYPELESFLIQKIARLIAGEEQFSSPVLDIVKREPSILAEVMGLDAINRLLTARTAINGVRRLFAASLTAYAMKRSNAKFSGSLVPLLSEIFDQQKVLKSIDWSGLKFNLKPHPAVDALIVQPPTIQVFPPHELSLFKTHVLEFYNYFFNTDSHWHDPTFDDIVSFAVESFILFELIGTVAEFIGAREDERKRQALEEFHTLVKKSLLMQAVFAAETQETPLATANPSS